MFHRNDSYISRIVTGLMQLTAVVSADIEVHDRGCNGNDISARYIPDATPELSGCAGLSALIGLLFKTDNLLFPSMKKPTSHQYGCFVCARNRTTSHVSHSGKSRIPWYSMTISVADPAPNRTIGFLRVVLMQVTDIV